MRGIKRLVIKCSVYFIYNNCNVFLDQVVRYLCTFPVVCYTAYSFCPYTERLCLGEFKTLWYSRIWYLNLGQPQAVPSRTNFSYAIMRIYPQEYDKAGQSYHLGWSLFNWVGICYIIYDLYSPSQPLTKVKYYTLHYFCMVFVLPKSKAVKCQLLRG